MPLPQTIPLAGQNNIVIVVTAGDGTTRTTILRLRRLAQDELTNRVQAASMGSYFSRQRICQQNRPVKECALSTVVRNYGRQVNCGRSKQPPSSFCARRWRMGKRVSEQPRGILCFSRTGSEFR